jgi:intein/homing endonuclease
MSNEKIAYLIGALMGDGCFSRQPNSVRIHFGSTDKEFANLIKTIIAQDFSISVKINTQKLSKKNPKWKDFYNLSSRTLYRKLASYMPSKDAIPEFIRSNDNVTKCAFISGLFDAEGGVSISRIKSRHAIDRRLHCTSANLTLLNEVKKYLSQIGIKSFIQDYSTFSTLNIWGYYSILKFQRHVGFKIVRKQKKLEELIKSYKEIHNTYASEIKDAALTLRKRHNIGATKIQQELKLRGFAVSKPAIEKWIYDNNAKQG